MDVAGWAAIVSGILAIGAMAERVRQLIGTVGELRDEVKALRGQRDDHEGRLIALETRFANRD